MALSKAQAISEKQWDSSCRTMALIKSRANIYEMHKINGLDLQITLIDFSLRVISSITSLALGIAHTTSEKTIKSNYELQLNKKEPPFSI